METFLYSPNQRRHARYKNGAKTATADKITHVHWTTIELTLK